MNQLYQIKDEDYGPGYVVAVSEADAKVKWRLANDISLRDNWFEVKLLSEDAKVVL